MRISAWVALFALLATGTVTAGVDVPPDWWERVRAQLEQAEYDITWQTDTWLADVDQAWHAANRAQGFRTYFTDAGIRVIDRTTVAPDWEWSLRLVRYGRGDEGRQVGPASLHASGNRIEYGRPGLAEWYVNDVNGLEQGFDLSRPPDVETESGSVFLELEVGGSLRPALQGQGQLIDFLHVDGRTLVRYSSLVVRDALGRDLHAWMELYSTFDGRGGLRLRIDDSEGLWPLTVDPIIAVPLWHAESGQAFSGFGASVASAGDVNADGYSDVVVGAPDYDNGLSAEGHIFVFHGSPSGPSLTPNFEAENNNPGSEFGFSVAPAGDVNGDGFGDIIVGSPRASGSEPIEGRAWVYQGSPTGLTVLNWTVDSDQHDAQLGYSVSSAGDVNDDGFADVIIGAPFFDFDDIDEGRAYVYLGSPFGLEMDPDWTAQGEQAGAAFGWTVSTAGDVNGDNLHDVVVGAPFFDGAQVDQGAAFVFHSSHSGLSLTPSSTLSGPPTTNGWYGYSVATAGDVNADGYSDVIVGMRQYSNGQSMEGAAFAYYGSGSGLPLSASWQVESNAVGANMGWAVATAGDINADLYADVIIGAPLTNNGQANEGRVYVYEGAATGLVTVPTFVNESNVALVTYGRSVATAGDVDGDGFSDVIIGAPLLTNGETEEGGATIHRGSVRGLDAAAGWSATSSNSNSQFGFSVAPAGDTDGDMFSDLVVGAPLYDNGQIDEGVAFLFRGSETGPAIVPSWTVDGAQNGAHLGWSVASAGDTNGDGYDDVIVGAPDFSNGQAGEGRASAYLGTVGGLSTIEAWSGEGNQAGAKFGFALAAVGDIDGDGRSDIAVGAPLMDNGEADEGTVSVYFGGPFGPLNVAAWQQDGDQAGAAFGHDVAGAGDVHGDGHAELIVGAPLYDGAGTDDGRVFVYRGTAIGLITQPFWVGVPPANASHYGWSVDGAGDVNGDGWSDVIVGAPFFSNGQAQEGAAFVYAGTGSDISDTPAWVAEGGQAQAWFGYSVSAGADFNGDGYSDVVVGAPQYSNGEASEGRASAYFGSGAGLMTVPAWTAEGNQASANFGWEVACGGDPNADGYADILVGAPLLDVPSFNEGRASLYYGNGLGEFVTPQQRKFMNDGPIGHLGVADGTTNFRLRARGKTAYGGGHVRLEWEVREQGVPLTGVPTGSSLNWIPGGPVPVAFSPPIENLTPGRRYHWQIRTQYRQTRTPWQQRGRWFRPPINGMQELDLRTRSQADLVLTTTDSKDPVYVGESYSYNVEILARGLHATSVTLRDQLPANVDLISVVPSQGECLEADHTVYCLFGASPQGATLNAEITVMPLAPGTQFNVSRVASTATELNDSNNSVQTTTLVNVPAIGNRVWEDLDGNGVQGVGEPGMGNVLVALYNGLGFLQTVVVTNPDGSYSLPALVFGNAYFVRFFPPAGYKLTAADQGNDLSDSDPNPNTFQTPVFSLVEQDDLVRWDAGLIPFCSAPDEPIFIASMDVTDDANRFPILNFQDPNQPVQVTGYNVYRSSDPQLPAESWPLVASDIVDMDEGTPNKQWVDSTGDEPPMGVWYYLVTAYNHRCPAEGPF